MELIDITKAGESIIIRNHFDRPNKNKSLEILAPKDTSMKRNKTQQEADTKGKFLYAAAKILLIKVYFISDYCTLQRLFSCSINSQNTFYDRKTKHSFSYICEII